MLLSLKLWNRKWGSPCSFKRKGAFMSLSSLKVRTFCTRMCSHTHAWRENRDDVMTRKSCAVGMRNAILRNHLKNMRRLIFSKFHVVLFVDIQVRRRLRDNVDYTRHWPWLRRLTPAAHHLRRNHWSDPHSQRPARYRRNFAKQGPVSRKPRKVFGPVKPFLDHLYLKTETCTRLKLVV